MKFISCHIENFGRLSDFSYDFAPGCNVICGENGWGKSTFAAFIRAMFYGLEGERKRNLAENERRKYRPWQGGVFGGQLVFEIQGRYYQIARIFHDKDTNDEFELRDVKTNLPSKDYSRKIGEEIFQIDRESFLRTVFIGQNECQTTSTDDINARLGNQVTDGANGLNNFDSAYARLTEIINALTPARASGLLAKRKEEIARLERIEKEGEGVAESMGIYRERMRAQEKNYNELMGNLKEAGRWQERISQMQSVSVEKSEWLHLKKVFEEKRQEEAAAGERFPKGVPALFEVKEQISQYAELEKICERAKLCQMSEKEEEELTELENIFWENMPSAAELDEKFREASELDRAGREHGGGMSPQEKKRFDELAPYFSAAKKAAAGEETEDGAALLSAWEERNRKKKTLLSDQDVLAELLIPSAKKKSGSKFSSFLFFAGILAAAAGIVTAWMYSMVPGIVLAAAGFLTTAAGIRMKVAMQMGDETEEGQNGNRRNPDNQGQSSGGKKERGQRMQDSSYIKTKTEKMQQIIAKDTEFIRQTDAKVDAYLKAHGREFGDYDEYEIGDVLQMIRMEEKEYRTLLKKAQGAQDGEQERRSKSIAAFLDRYGISVPQAYYVEKLHSVKERASRYAALADKRDKYEDAWVKYERGRNGIATFYKKYGIVPEEDISAQLDHILDAVYDYETAAGAFDRAASALEQFEVENDVSVFEKNSDDEEPAGYQEMQQAGKLPSLEDIHEAILAINEEMEQVRQERAQDQKVFDELQESYDTWEESRVKLEQLKEIQEVQQRKYELVFQARAKLAAAKEAMTAKYAAPILEGFSRYYEMLAGKSAACFHVDANAQVTVDEFGKQRGIGTFSAGLRDLAGICLRLAFVDAMYPQETPVLVMDDPFTNFDDEKLAAISAFLTEAAKKYQIIYFTCSSSRNVKGAEG